MGPRLLHYSDLENAYDDPERVGRLAGLLQQLDGDDAVLAGAGDDTSPGMLPLICEGRQALDLFEAVEPDVHTFGNHDFDYGPEATREIVRDSPQTWVSANVHRNGDRFAADLGTRPWEIVEAVGDRVGVFGLTDPTTESINPNADGLRFDDPVEAAREAVPALREEGVDYVVALSHLGLGDDELVQAVDVDAILGAHVHSRRIDRLNGTVLTRPGVNATTVLEVELPSGEVTCHDVLEAPLDESVAESLRERKRAAGLDEVVATVEEPIQRGRTQTFAGESRVGNLVADAYRWATGADVGLQNSGGIRGGAPLEGEVTVADLVSLVPFEEPIEVAELTGDELLAVLREAGGGNLAFGEDEWWHAHVGGAEVVYDRDAGEIVEASVDGEPVRPDRTYTLATPSFLFYTDHEFPSLTEDHRVETLDLQYEVVVEYAREEGLDPEIEGRVRFA